MGRAYECSACLHVQVVGVIDNGLSGFADPCARCAKCGAIGFQFGPGTHDRLAPAIAWAKRAALPGERP